LNVDGEDSPEGQLDSVNQSNDNIHAANLTVNSTAYSYNTDEQSDSELGSSPNVTPKPVVITRESRNKGDKNVGFQSVSQIVHDLASRSWTEVENSSRFVRTQLLRKLLPKYKNTKQALRNSKPQHCGYSI
jgi:hypothetical protein